MDKVKVGLLFGGRSQEHEVSIMSARSVLQNADKNKYKIVPVAITREGYWLNQERSTRILENNLENTDQIFSASSDIADSLISFLTREFDVVFPLLHGPYGEDGRVQGFLEMLNIPYVGSGVLGSALGMDKVKMKEIFSYYQIPQADFRVITASQFNRVDIGQLKKMISENPGYPCFIKPANMGSSIGITKVKKDSDLEFALKEAFNYDNKLLIEENIVGREVECSVLGNTEVEASLPGEIKPGHEFYDYEAKYKDEATELIIPAGLGEKTIKYIQQLAIKAFKVIEGRGFARVDFFISDRDNEVLVNEINTIPGFTEYSMYPKLWAESGISYPDLIDELIELAFKKQDKMENEK